MITVSLPTSLDRDKHIPAVRPHIRRRGDALYFMLSTRPILTLAPSEVPLYESIDGRKTIGELQKSHPDVYEKLARWHEVEILDLFPPVAPPTNPHLVVIEPHPDDAVLSVGGRLLHRREKWRMTILSVIGTSNFTSYLVHAGNAVGIGEVSRLREDESQFAVRMLGAEYQSLEWTDAPLRSVPPEQWSPSVAQAFKHRPSIFVNRFPEPRRVSQLADELWRRIQMLSPREIWMPMGMGEHVDHRLTRSACLLMLIRYRRELGDVKVWMYEDTPYQSDPQRTAILSALARAGGRLVREMEDVTDVFESKVRAASVYASQFKVSYIRGKLVSEGQKAGGGANRFGEVSHRLEGLLELPPESRFSEHHLRFERMEAELRRWSGSLTVITLPTGYLGRADWSSEMLRDTNLRIYLAEESAWEAPPGNSKWEVRIVPRTWKAWAHMVIREFWRWGKPTIILWSDAYRGGIKRFVIPILFPFRPVLVFKNFSEFWGLLEESSSATKIS